MQRVLLQNTSKNSNQNVRLYQSIKKADDACCALAFIETGSKARYQKGSVNAQKTEKNQKKEILKKEKQYAKNTGFFGL